MSESLVGTTTRAIHFVRVDHATKVVQEIALMPEGTEVYVRDGRRAGQLRLRVPGTLLSAAVSADAVTAA